MRTLRTIPAPVTRVVHSAWIRCGRDADSKTQYAYTWLQSAAGSGDVAGLRQLLAAGAELNRASRSGDTPLHLAAGSGGASVLQLLLAAAAE